MRKSRFSEDQIIAILKEHQAGIPVMDLCRKHGSAMRPSARGERGTAGWRSPTRAS